MFKYKNSLKINIKTWFFAFLFINKLSLHSAWVNKTSWFSVFIFAITLLIIFPFGLGIEALKRSDVQIGCYWIINQFVIITSVSRMFSAEQENNALDFLLSSKTSRSAILCGKISFTSLQILSLQIPILFFWTIFYHVDEKTIFLLLKTILPVTFLFNIGSSSLGALLTCITAKSLAKEILLPLLFFPLQCGILLASVSISIQVASNSLLGTFSSEAWWTILFMYPIIFTVLGILLSKILLQEQ
ncbi:heme exporter protein CcmB [Spirobacillus cienkowskii]|uniref:heme exporter protein CcmB n=1 Tax=Spirobacillus cienkowskii TaxID=495820 RepID=UPI0030CF311C